MQIEQMTDFRQFHLVDGKLTEKIEWCFSHYGTFLDKNILKIPQRQFTEAFLLKKELGFTEDEEGLIIYSPPILMVAPIDETRFPFSNANLSAKYLIAMSENLIFMYMKAKIDEYYHNLMEQTYGRQDKKATENIACDVRI